MRRRWIVVLVVCVTLAAAQPAAALEGFDPAEWNLVGGAAIFPGGPAGTFLRLTENATDLRGAAWLKGKQNVGGAWTFSFEYVITGNGADGLAFVIQADGPTKIGAGGAGLGYAGLDHSLAVELDTFGNADIGDPTFDHFSVHSRGRRANTTSETASIGRAQATVVDGDIHHIDIRYAAKRLSIAHDGIEELSVPINIPRRLDLTRRKAFIGFTAATGGLSQKHEVTSWSFTRP